jgi:hypothetical protein
MFKNAEIIGWALHYRSGLSHTEDVGRKHGQIPVTTLTILDTFTTPTLAIYLTLANFINSVHLILLVLFLTTTNTTTTITTMTITNTNINTNSTTSFSYFRYPHRRANRC